MKIALVIALNFAAVNPAFASPIKCAQIFALKGDITLEQIDQAISELAALRVDLDQTKAQGTTSIARGILAQKFESQQKLILQYLEKYQVMSRAQFIEKMKVEIAKIQAQKFPEKELEQKKETRIVQDQQEAIHLMATALVPNRVKPGAFKIWNYPHGVVSRVRITQTYDMMATPTTQYVWKAVVDLANKHLPGKYNLDPDPSHFKNETHPVEQVSRPTVMKWLSALNELSAAGEPALSQLILGHKQGDTYRLPSEAEWVMVLQQRGGLDLSTINPHEYGWFKDNSGGTTHPVGQKKPVVLDGREFFDMFGNVREWTNDLSDSDRNSLPTGTDPKGLKQDKEGFYAPYVVRGDHFDSFQSRSTGLRGNLRDTIGQDAKLKDIGFRIVRNVPEAPEKISIWQKISDMVELFK